MLECAQVKAGRVSAGTGVWIGEILNGSENLATYDVSVRGMCKKVF